MSGASAPKRGSMWRCPKCGRQFANRNQSHACGRYTLASHFQGKPAPIRAIFDRVLRVARRNGPITVLPEKTRIAFQVRMSFAAFVIRRNWIDGHVVLARRFENPRFRRIETFSPRNHLHIFRFESVDDVSTGILPVGPTGILPVDVRSPVHQAGRPVSPQAGRLCYEYNN